MVTSNVCTTCWQEVTGLTHDCSMDYNVPLEEQVRRLQKEVKELYQRVKALEKK